MKYACLALIATAAADTTWTLTAAHAAECPKPTAAVLADRKTAAKALKAAEKTPALKKEYEAELASAAKLLSGPVTTAKTALDKCYKTNSVAAADQVAAKMTKTSKCGDDW